MIELMMMASLLAAEPSGQTAGEVALGLMGGREAVVEYVKRDEDGNVVGAITIEGSDLNLDLISAADAWWFRRYPASQIARDREMHGRAYGWADRNRLGRWDDRSPPPPWHWRRGGRWIAGGAKGDF